MSRTKRARAVLVAHDRAANAGNLEAVLHNVADDVVVLAPGAPLMEGKEAFRAFYENMLETKWDATHDLAAAQEVWDVVVVHGVARGRATPPGGCPERVANNFLILLKPDDQGEFKIWRAAFGPVENGG